MQCFYKTTFHLFVPNGLLELTHIYHAPPASFSGKKATIIVHRENWKGWCASLLHRVCLTGMIFSFIHRLCNMFCFSTRNCMIMNLQVWKTSLKKVWILLPKDIYWWLPEATIILIDILLMHLDVQSVILESAYNIYTINKPLSMCYNHN